MVVGFRGGMKDGYKGELFAASRARCNTGEREERRFEEEKAQSKGGKKQSAGLRFFSSISRAFVCVRTCAGFAWREYGGDEVIGAFAFTFFFFSTLSLLCSIQRWKCENKIERTLLISS